MSVSDTGATGWSSFERGPSSLSVFISYRRTDVPDATDRLASSLSQRFGSDRVFVDVDSVEPGAPFAQVINRWIAHSDVLLVVIGQRWLDGRRLDDPNDYVRLELEAGLKRNIPVVPVLIHDAQMPTYADLPGSLTSLIERNAVQLSRAHWDADVGRLLAALDRVATAKSQQSEPNRTAATRGGVTSEARTAAAPEEPRVRLYHAPARRWPIPVAVAAVAAVVVAIVLIASSGSTPHTSSTTSSTSSTSPFTQSSKTDTTTQSAPAPAVINGHWPSTVGPLTLTVTQVKRRSGTVTVAMTASSSSSVTVPFAENLSATAPNGQTFSESSQYDYSPLHVPPETPVTASFQLANVPATTPSLTIFFADIFADNPSLVQTFANGIRITGVPVPHQ